MKGVNRFDRQSYFTAKKYARIIEQFSKKENLSLDDALNFFYHSEIYRLISEGVYDLHCDESQHLNDAGFYFFKSLLRLLTLLKKK